MSGARDHRLLVEQLADRLKERAPLELALLALAEGLEAIEDDDGLAGLATISTVCATTVFLTEQHLLEQRHHPRQHRLLHAIVLHVHRGRARNAASGDALGLEGCGELVPCDAARRLPE